MTNVNWEEKALNHQEGRMPDDMRVASISENPFYQVDLAYFSIEEDLKLDPSFFLKY